MRALQFNIAFLPNPVWSGDLSATYSRRSATNFGGLILETIEEDNGFVDAPGRAIAHSDRAMAM